MRIEGRRRALRLFLFKARKGSAHSVAARPSLAPLTLPVPGWILVFFLCVVFFPAARGEAAEVLRVTVPAVVQVEGEACALSDIARLEGPPALTERVGALLLSVRDGAIERQQVIDALKVSGLEGVRVELKMPALVRVEAPSANSPPENPTDGSGQALITLIKTLATWDGEVEVQYQGTVPEGRLVSPASIVPGMPAATLRFRDTSGQERSLAVRLAWSQSVLVLNRSVKKDEPLRASDFVVRRIGGVYGKTV